MAFVLPARLLLAQPVITVQPASQAVLTGSSASFSATVAGTEPLTYSWYFNATNPVPSGTNASLTLSNVSAADGGGYTLVVSDTVGSVTSVVATLLVALPPSLTLQPSSQSAWPGSNVTFSAAVSGTGPLCYRWFFNGAFVSNYYISTVAGGGPAGSTGDGGPATNAALGSPLGMAFDALGNLYFADYASNCVRKIDSSGTISTVAGNGVAGYAGDGGPATNASLNHPQAVACDRLGNLFIADSNNRRIRKVDPTGLISTVAGTGTNGFSGDGAAATNANLGTPTALAVDSSGAVYLADSGNSRIRKVATNGIITTVAGNGYLGETGDRGAATNASLRLSASTLGAGGMAFDDQGNLYVADTGNKRVRRVGTDGVISPFAGISYIDYGSPPASLGDGGLASLGYFLQPCGVAFDSLGNLYIADGSRIRRVDPRRVLTTVAGTSSSGFSGDGGLATNARLAGSSAVAVDGAGNVFVADVGNRRIRTIFCPPSLSLSNLTTAQVGSYALTVSSPWASVTSSVASLTLEGPPVLLSQPAAQTLWPNTTATFAVSATGTAPLAYAWYFNGTNAMADATDAQLTLTPVTAPNAGSYNVIVTNLYGSVTSALASLAFNQLVAQPTNQIAYVSNTVTLSVAVTGPGPLTYQWRCNGTNIPNNIIYTVAGNGTSGYGGDGGPATNASIGRVYDVTVDTAGNLYIADYNTQIRKVDTNGVITTIASGLHGPTGVTLDGFGNLYIADYNYGQICKLSTNGVLSTLVRNVNTPENTAFDTSGNLFICGAMAERIYKLDPKGNLTAVAGTGYAGFGGDGGAAINAYFYGPSGLAFDASGNLYVADFVNCVIRKIDTMGIITTVVGSGPKGGYSGDGGSATNALLSSPSDVAFDALGNLYIADSGNNRIRKVDTNGIITTVAGIGQPGAALGDGGPATNAQIIWPRGLGLDSAGNLYIADTEHRRIRKVGLAGLPTLTLNNLSLTNAGDYSVVISNPSGSITSAVATVTVLLPPSFTGIVPQPDGTVALSLSGTPNSTNVVWVTSDLTPPVNWLPLATNVAGADGTWQCIDPNPAGSSPRFYRASMP